MYCWMFSDMIKAGKVAAMLVECPECSAKVSSNAPACPHCGSPRKVQEQIGTAIPPPIPTVTPPSEQASAFHPGSMFRRGPVSSPQFPYQPETFAILFMWTLILTIASVPLVFIIIGFGTIIAAIVLSSIFLYKAWNQIQDGYQRTSAGMAVGFCFIPVFHLYWTFVAYHGLSQDINAYMRRNQIAAPPVSEGLALAVCILSLVSVIPVVWFFAAPAAIVTGLIFMHQVKVASMAIAKSKLTPGPVPVLA